MILLWFGKNQNPVCSGWLYIVLFRRFLALFSSWAYSITARSQKVIADNVFSDMKWIGEFLFLGVTLRVDGWSCRAPTASFFNVPESYEVLVSKGYSIKKTAKYLPDQSFIQAKGRSMLPCPYCWNKIEISHLSISFQQYGHLSRSEKPGRVPVYIFIRISFRGKLNEKEERHWGSLGIVGFNKWRGSEETWPERELSGARGCEVGIIFLEAGKWECGTCTAMLCRYIALCERKSSYEDVETNLLSSIPW